MMMLTAGGWCEHRASDANKQFAPVVHSGFSHSLGVYGEDAFDGVNEEQVENVDRRFASTTTTRRTRTGQRIEATLRQGLTRSSKGWALHVFTTNSRFKGMSNAREL